MTGVEVTADLSHANVQVSVMGTEEEKDRSLEGLVSAAQAISAPQLSKERFRLRTSPEIHFPARPRPGARAADRPGAEGPAVGERGALIDGVCLVSKPAGPTSHDVVDIVRRALGQSRVGHLGTLDPFAEGLLVMVVGRATRLAPYAAGWRKSYVGVIRLGAVTTTDDRTGEVTATSADAWRALEIGTIRAASLALTGPIEQKPPAFSAVKVGGVRAYEKARRGETVTVQARPVTVFELVVTEWKAPDVGFRATVSGGTYLRSLARDLGERLGCGGHLAELRRTAVGPFRLEDAVPAQALTPSQVKDPALLVSDLPIRILEPAEREAIVHGRPVPAREAEVGAVALMADGSLLAVGEVVDGTIKPRLVLADA